MKRLPMTALLLFFIAPCCHADDRVQGQPRRDGAHAADPSHARQRPSPAVSGTRPDGVRQRLAPGQHHGDTHTYNAAMCNGYQQQVYWQRAMVLQQMFAEPPVFIWKPMGTQGDPEKRKWYDNAVKRQQERTGYFPSQQPKAAGGTADNGGPDMNIPNESNVFPGQPVTDSYEER
jgi:hypothetical protein